MSATEYIITGMILVAVFSLNRLFYCAAHELYRSEEIDFEPLPIMSSFKIWDVMIAIWRSKNTSWSVRAAKGVTKAGAVVFCLFSIFVLLRSCKPLSG